MKFLKNSFDTGLKTNPAYISIVRKKKHFDCKQKVQPLILNNNKYKRLVYIRYADDFLIGIDSSKESANSVFKNVKNFLIETFNYDLKR